MITCPSGYYTQTLNSHNKCLQVCTDAFGDNITSSCVLSCPTPSFADPVTHLCVDTCSASYYPQIAISNGNRTCTSVCENEQWLHPYYLNCSRNPMDCPSGFYADNNTHTCNIKCSVLGQVGENTTRMCQAGCNTGYAYWAVGICVSICPSSPSLFGFVSGTARICVASCNSSITGLYGDVQANRSCVARCSATPISTFGDNSASLCSKQCSISNEYGDPNDPNRLCVTWCSYTPIQTY